MVNAPRGLPYRWTEDWGLDEAGVWTAFAVHGHRCALRWIPAGSFLMGSPEHEHGRSNHEHLHRVTLTQGYWLGETTVSQALWQAVMGENRSRFKGPDLPVDKLFWGDVQDFLARLCDLKPGLEVRLPTEAEWEHACRAGKKTPFHFGERITTEQANYDGSYPYPGGQKQHYREKTLEVRALPPNRWGLYQMHGNVWEWCSDWYGEYTGDAVDPQGPSHGEQRVLRGGSWYDGASYARSACRDPNAPGVRYGYCGLRLARGP